MSDDELLSQTEQLEVSQQKDFTLLGSTDTANVSKTEVSYLRVFYSQQVLYALTCSKLFKANTVEQTHISWANGDNFGKVCKVCPR